MILILVGNIVKLVLSSHTIFLLLNIVIKFLVLQRYFIPYGVKDQRDTLDPP